MFGRQLVQGVAYPGAALDAGQRGVGLLGRGGLLLTIVQRLFLPPRGTSQAFQGRTIGDALLRSSSLVSVTRESETFGLDIAPANQELAILDKVLYGRQGYEFHLKNSLDAMGGDFYSVILIDCPPSFGTLTLNALTAADLLIVPVQCEYYAGHALRQIMELAKRKLMISLIHWKVMV